MEEVDKFTVSVRKMIRMRCLSHLFNTEVYTVIKLHVCHCEGYYVKLIQFGIGHTYSITYFTSHTACELQVHITVKVMAFFKLHIMHI